VNTNNTPLYRWYSPVYVFSALEQVTL